MRFKRSHEKQVKKQKKQEIKNWRVIKNTNATSPSTSGKTYEKTSAIHIKCETKESLFHNIKMVNKNSKGFNFIIGILIIIQ